MAIGDHVRKYLAEKEAGGAEFSTPAPKAHAPADAPPDMASVMLMLAEAIKGMKEGKSAEEKDAALTQADLLQQILQKTRPENVAPPLMGVFANPKGERDDPKPDLKCPMYQVGFQLRKEVLTPREIELLNLLEPGEYRVQKSDGNSIPFIVLARRSSDLKIERLDLSYNVKDDDRHNHGSLTSYLEQVTGAQSQENLFAELERLRGELAKAKAA